MDHLGRAAHLTVLEKRSALEQRQRLAESGLASQASVEEARTSYLQAQIRYQQAFLSLFSGTARISVEKAVKSTTPQGANRVTLTLKNTSGASLDYRQLGVAEDEVPVPDYLKLREVRDLVVSLKNQDGFVLSLPYETIVNRLEAGESIQIEFELLKDIDSVIVSLGYAGRVEDRQLLLQKDSTANFVSLQSVQFSQEADLGGSVLFDLNLERFTSTSNVFLPMVLGLPREIDRAFLTATDSSIRLNQIRFSQGETKKTLALSLSLPEIATSLPVDEPIHFWVVLLDQSHAPADPTSDETTTEAILSKAAGKTRLELIPRGVGKLEATADNLFLELNRTETGELGMTLKNAGTRVLSNARVVPQTPVGWQVDVSPAVVERLAVGQEARVLLRLAPRAVSELGDYNIRVRSEANSNSRTIDADEKIVRVSLTEDVNLWASALLMGSILVILVGVVVAGVKITRR